MAQFALMAWGLAEGNAATTVFSGFGVTWCLIGLHHITRFDDKYGR